MNEIQKIQLDRIMVQLHGMGAKFCILIEGEKFGTLEPAPEKHQGKRTRAPSKDYSALKIPDTLRAMAIGDVHIFKPLPGLTLGDIAGAISSHAVGIFGKGNGMTIRVPEKDEVQCMRLG